MGNKRHTFGIIVDWPDPNSMYQGTLLEGVRAFSAKYEINLITIVAGRLDSPDKMEKNRELLYNFMNNDRLFSGFILFSSPLSSLSGTNRLYMKIQGITDLPVISIAIDLPDLPAVLINSKPGFSELIEHLILHHRYSDIAYISGPDKNDEAAERLDIIRGTFSKHGIKLPESRLYFGNFTVQSGADAVEYFLDSGNSAPEAIIAANDYMAMGAWEELGARGIAIPEEIAVTGFDDLQISDMFDLPVTTVKQPLFDQGYCAAEKLYKRLHNQEDPRITSLPSRVIYRHSCGCDTHSIRQLPDDAQSHQMEESFAETNGQLFRTAVSTAVETGSNIPLLRCWNQITRQAINRHMRQTVILHFLHTIHHDYMEEDHSQEERQLMKTNLDKLKLITLEAYIQSESLNRMNNTLKTDLTMGNIENLGSDIEGAPDMEERLRSINWFLEESNIKNCYISIFEDLKYKKNGKSKLVFCRYDGQAVNIPEDASCYRTRELMHMEYLPEHRYELLVELLFDPNNIFGLIIIDMMDIRFSFYEMLRTRLSAIIQDSLNKKLLRDAIDRLQDLSLTDDLTGLYNRRGFFTMSEQQLRYCKREGEPYAVYFIDLDGLKTINDTLGHNEGDKAIIQSAGILKDSFRETDIIARLGGDEFAVFISNTDKESKETISGRISEYAARANKVGEFPFTISMSIGTCFSEDITSQDSANALDQMLKTADENMYTRKSSKRNAH